MPWLPLRRKTGLRIARRLSIVGLAFHTSISQNVATGWEMASMEYIVMGLLGGIARALMMAKSFKELKRYSVVRAMVLGFIGGIVYYHMVQEWGAPDTVVAFFFAYSFTDIIDRLAELVVMRVRNRGK